MRHDEIKTVVREGYSKIGEGSASCCGDNSAVHINSKNIGYTNEDLKQVPEGSNLGLGCGNPVALGSLMEGETVLDLGSGAGFDCFLAANRVGKNGTVIGVDMTPEMVEKARENARKGNYSNVEFRLGDIENLPVADSSIDAIISNCVINLVPDKKRVFDEAYRVLKPNGRIMISDIVLVKELPIPIAESIEAYVGCISGAMMINNYLETVKMAGFEDVRVSGETFFSMDCMANDTIGRIIVGKLGIPTEKIKDITGSVKSIKVLGSKPNRN